MVAGVLMVLVGGLRGARVSRPRPSVGRSCPLPRLCHGVQQPWGRLGGTLLEAFFLYV